MWATITKPFAWLMIKLYDWTGSYGLSVILFALVVNLILSPFMGKSKKSSMRTTRLQPKIQELQKRHEGNQQKLNEEMQKLYREEGINPMSGCLWSLIPFPILIALYSVIRQPLSRMMFIASEAVTAVQEFCVSSGWYVVPAKADAYYEITLAGIVHEHWTEFQEAIASGNEILSAVDLTKLKDIDFSFLGMDMGSVPDWKIWSFDFSDAKLWLPAVGLFLIPIVSALLSWVSMKVSSMSNPQQDAQMESSMKTMNLMMPLMSVWFCFIMPAAMGIYWIANSLFGMVRDYVTTKIFKKQLDKEDEEKIKARSERERELELKRLETERKHAEGTNEKNTNTSKKNIQAAAKQKDNERKDAIRREERAARRQQLGVEENEIPPSQVGNRRYARGRAYDPNRFGTAPEADTEKSGESLIDKALEEAGLDAVPAAEAAAPAAEKTDTVPAAAGEVSAAAEETAVSAAEQAAEAENKTENV